MTTNTETEETQSGNQGEGQNVKPTLDAEALAKLVEEQVAERLKEIKGKLDNAYQARDEARKKAEEYEKEKRAAELARLEEEGKHKEAYEMRLKEEREAREKAERRAIELSRDVDVRQALSAYPFRNDNASEMAYREIVGQLVQDANGNWVHRSGVSIKDFVKAFAEHEDNTFLFKPKHSTGGGSTNEKPANTSTEKKSLFEMSQEEVLKLAGEGKIARRR